MVIAKKLKSVKKVPQPVIISLWRYANTCTQTAESLESIENNY
jgi:hypothetical protein